jgi:hypothetical protein
VDYYFFPVVFFDFKDQKKSVFLSTLQQINFFQAFRI